MIAKITLLDRSLANLRAAYRTLDDITDDTDVDIAAYNAQQCLELAIKYAITMKGKKYTPSHLLDDLWDDLMDDEIQELVQGMDINIDNWGTTARYKLSINSSINQVKEVLMVCEKILDIIKDKYVPSNLSICDGCGATVVLNRLQEQHTHTVEKSGEDSGEKN